MTRERDILIKKLIEFGVSGDDAKFIMALVRVLEKQAKKYLIEEQIQTLKDLSKDSFEVYELKLLLEDYK